MISIQHESCSNVNGFLHNLFSERNTGRVVRFFSMDYKKLISERLVAARLAMPRKADGKHWTQEDVSLAVPGLSESRYGNYEQGIRTPKMDVLPAIAQALNEPLAWISGMLPDGDMAELARAFYKMDDADREDVLHYVKRRKSLAVATPTEHVAGVVTTTKSKKKNAG